jgi:hypothetical protein
MQGGMQDLLDELVAAIIFGSHGSVFILSQDRKNYNRG